MSLRRALILGVPCVVGLAGCGIDFSILLPEVRTAVRVVNDADFAVDVELYFDDEDDIPEEILTQLDSMEFIIAPGEVFAFSRPCDDLRAIIIDDADLLVLGGVGPETDTGVLREGDEFECGDTIEFRFDHSEVILDFGIDVTVSE